MVKFQQWVEKAVSMHKLWNLPSFYLKLHDVYVDAYENSTNSLYLSVNL